ncbi:hypothetical protein LPJ61_006289 [Coemansia biformis]|uniref:ABC transporter domain-containing protein n=1 Tax=Coemansia biformis TaxID=1286918 RepID=A0A9W8CQ71_9FUNG|nr:hypothetical protein LPJ61_006289 [Coemansia biformis]
MFAALAAYGLQHGLDAETTFTAIAVFRIVQSTVSMMPAIVAQSIGFYVSFRHIEVYLGQPEVDALEDRVACGAGGALGLDDAPADRAPGKSSLLAALIGETELVRGRVCVPAAAAAGVCVPAAAAAGGGALGAAGGLVLDDVAFVPQEPWLRKATVRDNILLGERFCAKRYACVHARSRPTCGRCQPATRRRLALARTLVRRSRLVVMDEATASVDFATDAALQRAIRGAELADSTLVCIAHRLRTVIDYDRILVLDEGRVAEFDTPARLLRRDGGLFHRLCEDSGELAQLERLAQGA